LELHVLDLAGILFSSLMLLLVILRAAWRDRTQPWFQSIAPKDRPDRPRARTWQRHG